MEKYSILIVEDDIDVNNYFKIRLEKEGYYCKSVETAEEALVILEEEFFEIALVDYKLPKMYGLELLKLMKKKYPESIRLLITGFPDVPLLEKAINEGEIFRFLKKPIRGFDLVLNVKNAIEYYDLKRQNKELVRNLEEKVQEKTKSLIESEAKFRDLFENATELIQSVDADGKFNYVNKKWKEVLGYTTEEVKKLRFSDILREDQISHCMEKFRQLCSSEINLENIDTIFQSKDGKEIFVNGNINSRFKDDKFIETRGMFRNITERKEAEDSLRKLSTAIEQSPASVVITNLNGDIEYVNPKFTQLTGYTLEEAKGKNPRILKSGEQPEEFYKELWDTITSGKEWSGEFHNKKKNGELYWEYASISPIVDNEGKITNFVAVKEDITKQKKSEDESKKLNENLTHQIAFANEMAEQARKANESKSEFLANMSHEIRTPMNGVIGMADVLLSTELTQEQREYTEIVKTSADSLLMLINDILDYSKLESGKLDIEVIDFDLRMTLKQTITILLNVAQKKGLELTNFIHSDVPSLLSGDPGRLRQILTNLIGNAIKFTSSGGITVGSEVEKEDDTYVTVKFSVKDTGVGIPEERRKVIFEKFTQADSSTTRKYGGTGLGLTISKNLSEMMGGEIGVESGEGRGSTFWFTVVFEKQQKAIIEPVLVSENIRGVRILVVDDIETDRSVTREQLEKWECRCDEVSDGVDALVKLRNAASEGDSFRVVIIDMLMPGMDGELLGRIIKEDSVLQDTELVILCSTGTRGDASRLEKMGFSAYLIKPVKNSQLYDCLVTILSRETDVSDDEIAKPIITRHSIAEDRKRKVRILLTEDNPVNQKVATIMLEKQGYYADIAINGREALIMLEKEPYDVVLMDIQMPEMNGFEATAAIRKKERETGTHIPIIAMTANALKGDREKCLEAGMDDYISIPVKSDDLIKVIEKHIFGPAGATDSVSNIEEKIQGGKIFDRNEFIERMGDEESCKMIAGVFVKDICDQIKNLKKAFKDNDVKVVERVAHSIKGASDNITAQQLRDIALEIETAGRNNKLDNVRTDINKLEQEFDRLKTVLSGSGMIKNVAKLINLNL